MLTPVADPSALSPLLPASAVLPGVVGASPGPAFADLMPPIVQPEPVSAAPAVEAALVAPAALPGPLPGVVPSAPLGALPVAAALRAPLAEAAAYQPTAQDPLPPARAESAPALPDPQPRLAARPRPGRLPEPEDALPEDAPATPIAARDAAAPETPVDRRRPEPRPELPAVLSFVLAPPPPAPVPTAAVPVEAAASDAPSAVTAAAPGMSAPLPGLMLPTPPQTAPESFVLPAPPPRVDLAAPDWPVRVADTVISALVEGRQDISVDVAPERLGPLRLRVAITDRGTEITIAAAHPDTAQMLRAAQPDLQRCLAEAGLSLNAAGAQTGDQSFGQSAQDAANQFAGGQHSSPHPGPRPDPAWPGPADPAPRPQPTPRATPGLRAGALNLIA